jgi:hypothetical protein
MSTKRKRCTKCGRRRSIRRFYARKDSKDGLHSHCIDCQSDRDAVRYAQHREEIKAQTQSYRDSDPRKIKSIRDRHYAKLRKDPKRWKLFLKNCRAWLKRNPKKNAEYCARRRALRNGAIVVDKIDRDAIYLRDQGVCHICTKKVRRDRMTLDHVIPLTKHGSHTAANLRVAHRSCNSRKGNRLLEVRHGH